MALVKATKGDLENYFKSHQYSTYSELSRALNISESLLRKKFYDVLVTSLNYRNKYIFYTPLHNFDINGLKEINGILFSLEGNIKSTLLSLIKKRTQVSSREIYKLLGPPVGPQISQLLTEKKIFMKKKGRHSIYSLEPFQDEIIREEEFLITSLNEDDKVLKDLQIIKELKRDKKSVVSKRHGISPQTVSNIEKRFKKGGVKGLIHARKPKTTKISSAAQAAIIAEAVKHPNKSPEQIKKSLDYLKTISIEFIEKTISRVKKTSKKKLLLEIR